MSTVNPSQSNAGDLITAAAINNPVNQLAAVINGGIDSTNLASNAVTAAKLAAGAVTTVSVNRQNDNTNIVEATAKIQTGWGYIPSNGTNVGSETVNFPVAFTGIPIVTATYGGDSASSTALGGGAITVKAAAFCVAHSETTTNFVIKIQSSDGTNWTAGNSIYYKWTAIGI